MSRLNTERQKELEPKRIESCFLKIKSLGFDPYHDGTKITFLFKDQLVTYFAYSGWATGKSIKDGRGFENLLKQLK